MISRELEAEIIRLHHVEDWPIGTIASQLHVHHEAVKRALKQHRMPRPRRPRPSRFDAYLPFVLDTLNRYPRITAGRLYEMCRQRGYQGGPDHFRHMVARHRAPRPAEAYLRMTTLPGEQGQVDWGHFGKLQIGRAERPLMGFVLVLSYSRAIHLRFFLDQQGSNFLRGHQSAFEAFGGVPRVLLYDNLKSAVLERRGDAIRFNPLLIDFAAHHGFEARPVAVARGNEKGRVERAIRYVRSSFMPARTWRDLDDLNAQAQEWCEGLTMQRPWPDDKTRTVAAAFAEEQPKLLPLPQTSFVTEDHKSARVGKTPYVRFDRNDYSVPHKLTRRTLEIRATQDRVRVLNGSDVVADHPRSFDRGQRIEDPAHVVELKKAKGEMRRHRGMDRLTRAVPSSQQLFVRLAERGLNLGRATQLALRLLDEYGSAALERAAREAIDAGVVDYHALRCILERDQHAAGKQPPVPPTLPDDPRVRGLAVSPPDLKRYDDLARPAQQPPQEETDAQAQ
jgi:transposase